ncbi:alkaline phosphatase family protein [Cytophagaceae bacterium DM2B3-1]|uniref:Alkaline phosphatase family protein n=1 Tax=Xanthocytophaga flava TaxID=3048013 RepID=A0ABT7CS53_9BACT|nr:alkaline phosphatase family protein [Xanthocytophaga flavus]MDJ1471696.1 alkaline phosphatase family protein [Xanthocytophaga flavus]MDJ1496578.1 alkaline phosphatase family protein [Xanthocytophaga flavus]
MRKKYIPIVMLVFMANIAMAQKKKAVFVIIDGVSRDILDKVPTPYLHEIAKEGGLINANQGGELNSYTQTPTISAPGYTNVLTGVWFNKHNVPDNDIKAPNYHYPTIFRLFENQYPDKQTAVFSSWEDNRTKLVGEGLSQTNGIKLDYHFDGLELDTVKYPHDKQRKFMSDIDQAVTDEAARYIKEKGPDLSWVYLEFTDDMGHMYGDSEKYNDAVKAADKRIGQLWDAIKLRQKENKEEWVIMVTTDHGRDAKTGRNHGGQSERERASWIVTNAKPLNTYAKGSPVSVVDILPTLARFLDVSLSADELRELDGVPLVGKVSLVQPKAIKTAKALEVSWKPIDTEGKVKVWITTSNGYKETGKFDTYTLLGEVPVKDGKFAVDLSKIPASDFYKVVLEGKYNTVNRWITK